MGQSTVTGVHKDGTLTSLGRFNYKNFVNVELEFTLLSVNYSGQTVSKRSSVIGKWTM